MQEIIIPEDGIVYKTKDGTPVLQISFENEATIFQMLSKNENSKIVLVCHDNESGIFIGNGPKSIMMTNNTERNDIQFINENGKVTHLFYTTEEGGQIDLCDASGNPLISMGPNKGEGNCGFFLRNSKEKSVVTLLSNRGNGNVLIMDKEGNYSWTANEEGV
jgi:hypothetical protein